MRKTYGTKRFTIGNITKNITLLIGSNMSGKTKSLTSLHEKLTERNQTVQFIDCTQITEYDLLGRPLDKINLLTKLLNTFNKQGYILLDNFDTVFDYASTAILVEKLQQLVEESDYLYIIMSVHTIDTLLVFQQEDCTIYNNETGKFIDIQNYTLADFRKLRNTRKQELKEMNLHGD